MIDINVLKKGGFNQFSNKSKAAQKYDDFALKQEEGKSHSLIPFFCRTNGWCWYFVQVEGSKSGSSQNYNSQKQALDTDIHEEQHKESGWLNGQYSEEQCWGTRGDCNY